MKNRLSKINVFSRLIKVAAALICLCSLCAAQPLTYVTSWLGNTFPGTPNMWP